MPEPAIKKIGKDDPKKVTPEEWRSVLSKKEFEVTREGGTEEANKGELTNHFKSGKYQCKCCGIELFVLVIFYKLYESKLINPFPARHPNSTVLVVGPHLMNPLIRTKTLFASLTTHSE